MAKTQKAGEIRRYGLVSRKREKARAEAIVALISDRKYSYTRTRFYAAEYGIRTRFASARLERRVVSRRYGLRTGRGHWTGRDSDCPTARPLCTGFGSRRTWGTYDERARNFVDIFRAVAVRRVGRVGRMFTKRVRTQIPGPQGGRLEPGCGCDCDCDCDFECGDG